MPAPCVGVFATVLALSTQAAMPPRAQLATGTSMDTTRYSVVLHVDTAGNDASDGSSRQNAVKTIGKAFEIARTSLAQKIGVKVLIHAGRYHEPTIRMDGTSFEQSGTGGLFVVEGEEKGKVIISGSERAGWEPSTWTRVSPDSLLYTHSWPYAWPWDCGTLSPTGAGCLGWHREMLVLNGKFLRQSLTRSTVAAAPNYFIVDTVAKTVTMHPSRALTDADLVEIPAQLFLFRVSAKNYVAVKKIIFEHENSCIQAAQNDGDGWGVAVGFRTEGRVKTNDLLIEDCVFRTNNSCALKIYNCNNITIRRCVANDNGWKGIGVGACSNVLMEDCETSYNSWRQLWSQGTGWDAGGVKVISDVSRMTIRRHYADSNTCASGIWLDWNNRDMTLDSCVFERHIFDAMYIECTPGPTTITNCIVRRSPSGLFSFGTSNTIVEDCRFENVGTLFALTADTRSQCTSNRNFYVRRCYLNGRGPHFGGGDWTNFFNTLDIDSNQYWNNSGTASTQLFMDASAARINFPQWQALGKDVHSTWLTGPVSVADRPARARADLRTAVFLRSINGSPDLDVSLAPGHAVAEMRVYDLRGRCIGRPDGDRQLRISAVPGVIYFDLRGTAGDRRVGSHVIE